MAVMYKCYPLAPEILKNVICDIREMRKAKVARFGEDELEMITEMYNIKTAYRFRLTGTPTGTQVMVESGGEDEDSKQNVAYMFAMLDGMLDPLIPFLQDGSSESQSGR